MKYSKKDILPIAGIVVGIVLLSLPVVVDQIETIRNNKTVTSGLTAVEQLSDEEYAYVLEQAQAYNEALAENLRMSKDILPYNEQLQSGYSPMIAYVEIPKIRVKLPVFHGTDEASLSAGAGHLEQTSLPIGGASTHTVISAHSGMISQRMFDDLRDITIGDTFVIWTLGKPLAYRVYDIETVLPSQVEALGIQAGKDIATLVTCTPYGVNSHRLLVHGERCDYNPEIHPPLYVSKRWWPLVAAIIAMACMSIGGSLVIWKMRYNKRKQESGVR
ncbi:MAG: class C sortase [Eggerthellaceae bacterium]|nr:class C sortase [Eggerthellaceae bacterium]